MIPVPYKVWGTIRVIDILYMWRTICICGGTILYLFHISYGGTIRVIRHEDTSQVGGPYDTYSI